MSFQTKILLFAVSGTIATLTLFVAITFTRHQRLDALVLTDGDAKAEAETRWGSGAPDDATPGSGSAIRWRTGTPRKPSEGAGGGNELPALRERQLPPSRRKPLRYSGLNEPPNTLSNHERQTAKIPVHVAPAQERLMSITPKTLPMRRPC